MTYTIHTSNIRNIRQDDAGFYITDGLRIAARAGLEISPECPKDVAYTIQQAMSKKWITFVANIKDNELLWETLNK